ncbi:MAG: flagellar brake protein [Chromatiales bacterium]|jgi:c-di-GMP-binding flagellar brake protein YcgR
MFTDTNYVEVISNPQYIFHLLQQAHATRNRLTITSTTHGTQHASAILEVNKEDNSLLIDALSQGQSLPAGKTEFTVMLVEVSTWFTVNTFERETIGDDVYYRTPFPKSLYRLQRRTDYRVALPISVSGKIHTPKVDDNRPVIGIISNISLGGIGFIVPSVEQCYFEAYSKISGAFIELEDICSLTADLEVRHIVHSSETKSTFIGSSFCELETSKLRKIMLAVQELQRIELRNRTR